MKTTYASLALSLAMAGSAMAADLPSRRVPPVYIPPVPVFTWTGFYIGAQVGYGFGDTKDHDITDAVFTTAGQNSSAIGGVHVGYNYELGNALGAGMFGGGLVVGLEGDIEGSNNTSTNTFLVPAGFDTDKHQANIEGSVRGRLGIAVDRALFYATGGAAFAQFKDSQTFAGLTDNYSTSRVGWTVGGGVEYAVTPNWLLRAEYRYTDFGSYFLPAGVALTDETRRVQEQKVEFGVSYLFSTPVAPVVARY